MSNHNNNLKRSVLVLSGIVGGLAVAATLVSCAGDTADTAAEPAPTTNQTDQTQIRQNTATPEQPPATVVVYVSDKGTVNNNTDNPDNTENTPTVETEDTDEAPVVEVPADDDTPTVETEDTDDAPVVEVPADDDTDDSTGDPVDPDDLATDVGPDDDEAPVVEATPDDDDDDGPVIVVVVPELLDIIEEYKPWEPFDICDHFPWLCEDEEILVELPEPCDPDEGTCPDWMFEEILEELPEPCVPDGCPVWVIDDLIETFESFNFAHNPIEKLGPIGPIEMAAIQPLIPMKWTPTGP